MPADETRFDMFRCVRRAKCQMCGGHGGEILSPSPLQSSPSIQEPGIGSDGMQACRARPSPSAAAPPSRGRREPGYPDPLVLHCTAAYGPAAMALVQPAAQAHVHAAAEHASAPCTQTTPALALPPPAAGEALALEPCEAVALGGVAMQSPVAGLKVGRDKP